MHLVHTYIAYRVSTSVVYIVVVYYTCRIGTVTCVCVTHTNPLTRYLVEGVCTLTTPEITYRVISIVRCISEIFLKIYDCYLQYVYR